MYTYFNPNNNDLIESYKKLDEDCLLEITFEQYEILSLIYVYGKERVQDALNFYDEIVKNN